MVEVLANVDLRIDNKAEFQEEANLKPVFEALQKLGLKPEMRQRRRALGLGGGLSTIRPTPSGAIGLALAAQPEYRRFRALARTIAQVQRAAFRGGEERAPRRRSRTGASCSTTSRTKARSDASVQRYKGLGEMNAEQLADTTMNPEKRTLLQVRLEDAVESEEIFSTLMGEDVESRRKFIEENALDVKNLDV